MDVGVCRSTIGVFGKSLMKSNRHAGQFNLKGKLFKSLRCGCCEIIDFRWRERIKQAEKEMRNSNA